MTAMTKSSGASHGMGHGFRKIHIRKCADGLKWLITDRSSWHDRQMRDPWQKQEAPRFRKQISAEVEKGKAECSDGAVAGRRDVEDNVRQIIYETFDRDASLGKELVCTPPRIKCRDARTGEYKWPNLFAVILQAEAGARFLTSRRFRKHAIAVAKECFTRLTRETEDRELAILFYADVPPSKYHPNTPLGMCTFGMTEESVGLLSQGAAQDDTVVLRPPSKARWFSPFQFLAVPEKEFLAKILRSHDSDWENRHREWIDMARKAELSALRRTQTIELYARIAGIAIGLLLVLSAAGTIFWSLVTRADQGTIGPLPLVANMIGLLIVYLSTITADEETG